MTKRNFFLLIILGFCTMWQKADAQITLDKPVLSGPSISLVGSIEKFYCKLDNIQTDKTILYEFLISNLNKPIGEYSAHDTEEARFIIVTKPSHDGRLICKASVQNNTEINPTFSAWKIFQVLVPVKGAKIISRTFSEDFWEGDSLTLECIITEGTYVTYDWFLNNILLHSDSSNNQLTIPTLSSRDSGQYVCVAKNYFNETTYFTSKSEGRNVLVKEFVSKPEISLKVVKDAEGNLIASVKCQVEKGSLPINFTLIKDNHKFAEDITQYHNGLFFVPINLVKDKGMVYCEASNGKTPMQSGDLNLKVGFCAMWQESDAQIMLDKPVLSGPSISLVGSIKEFYCKLDNIQTDETILYEIFMEHNLNKPIGEYSAHDKEKATFYIVTKLSHDGRLICKASVQNNTKINPTFSALKIFQVVVPVKGAKIISRTFSEDFWEGDSLTLECNITEGTYVKYDWFLNNILLHSDSSNNQLTIPTLSSRDSGQYVCVAKNYVNETTYFTSKSEGMNVRVNP